MRRPQSLLRRPGGRWKRPPVRVGEGGMGVQELLSNLVEAQAKTQEQVEQARQAAERRGVCWD